MSDAAIFHIRIRCASDNPMPLTDATIGSAILASAADYAQRGQWACYLLLLMPDHLHALLSFGQGRGMSETLRK
ncbi:MAG: hypothetical protein EPN23_00450 [Verrucomicrobia bacterium]|nr:MAG: hypothetical protein EPN23_00450 [Verrucomicrobiota bacterium]